MRVCSQVFALMLLFAGCASNLPYESLETQLPEESDYEGIVFSAGPWHSPGSREAYLLSPEYFYLLQRSEAGETLKHLVRVEDCPELLEARKTLISSIATSVEISAHRIDSTENKLEEILIMDGPDYKLQYYSGESMTKHTLEGGGNAAIRSPWVDAAFEVIEIGSGCDDS